MKLIQVYFEDEEHEALLVKKGGLTWHDYILTLVENREETYNLTKRCLEVNNE